MTPASFKRSIRDLQVWCSSCMVAFSGGEPVGVLIGAKRASSTLVHRIAVHPDHRRQGHGRHLLDSLASKLAILGPSRIVAEIADPLVEARTLFNAMGYVEEAVFTDYVWQPSTGGESRAAVAGTHENLVLIPVTIDDLIANGLPGDNGAPTCWERSVETLTARKHESAGLALASEERIEAYLLYIKEAAEILILREVVEDGGARLEQLLSCLAAARPGTVRLPKVHPDEIPADTLQRIGFRPTGMHRLYAARLHTTRP